MARPPHTADAVRSLRDSSGRTVAEVAAQSRCGAGGRRGERPQPPAPGACEPAGPGGGMLLLPPPPVDWLAADRRPGVTGWSELTGPAELELLRWVETAQSSPPAGTAVEEVAAADLGHGRFVSEFLLPQRPLVVRGGVAEWLAADPRWDPAGVRQRMGDALAITSDRPNAGNFGLPEDNARLGDFLDGSMPPPSKQPARAARGTGGGAPLYCRLYAFDDGTGGARDGPNSPAALYAGITVPRFMDGAAGSRAGVPISFSAEPVFHIGPAGSGSPPHHHLDTYNGAVFGRKLWAIFPAGHTVFSGGTALGWWANGSLAESLSALPACERPALFVQHPGDLVYVPGGVAHAVINVEDALGLVMEFYDGR